VLVEPVDRPALVTSAEGAWWQEGELTEMAGANATVTVDASTTYQEWSGMGGTFNEAGWDALLVLGEAERQRAIRLLFDAAEGANFAWGRFPIGASDYAMDRYALSEQAGDYEMTAFSIERDKELLIPYIKAALAVKPNIRLWASPWSPPAWMKDNDDMNGGRIQNDPQVLDAYALYFAKFVQAYAAEGLDIEAIHPQNEPGYETNYPSCLWTPELLRDFVRDYLAPKLVDEGVEVDIWFGTMSAPEDAQHVTTAMGDMATRQLIKGIGAQWNLSASVGSWVSQYGVPVMQTEHKCGNYRWETATFNPDRPPNDLAYAEETWGLFKEWIGAGVNSYSAWNMVLDTIGMNLDAWPQNALLTVDRNSGTLTATPAYYVFRHISYFVDPGAVRIGTQGGDALAFQNPDGSIITVVFNSGGQPATTSVAVGGTTVQFTVPGRGWATVNWE
jgi:glucosylceramidase